MPINDTLYQNTANLDSISQAPSLRHEPTIVIIKDTVVNVMGMNQTSGNVTTDTAADPNISVLLTIIYLGLGVGIYFLLAFLKKYIIPVIVQRYQKKNIPLFWYRFTVIIWLAYSLITLYVFLKASALITIIILVFTGLLFYHFMIDFMVGVYFRFENNIKINDHFILNHTKGSVQAFCSRHLKIITNKSEEIYIPYRNLLAAPVHILKEVDSLIERQFTVNLAGETSQNLQLIQKYMNMCPWIHDSSLFKISSLKNDTYQISVRVKEEFTANKIESFIKSKIH